MNRKITAMRVALRWVRRKKGSNPQAERLFQPFFQYVKDPNGFEDDIQSALSDWVHSQFDRLFSIDEVDVTDTDTEIVNGDRIGGISTGIIGTKRPILSKKRKIPWTRGAPASTSGNLKRNWSTSTVCIFRSRPWCRCARRLSRCSMVPIGRTLVAKKVASRWVVRRAGLETPVKALMAPWQGTAKNWPGLVREVASLFGSFGEDLDVGKPTIKVVGTTWATAYGKQIGGYRPGDPPHGRGLDPPEYAEAEFEAPETLEVLVPLAAGFKELARDWAKAVKPFVDEVEFRDGFLERLRDDDKFRGKFVALAVVALKADLAGNGKEWLVDAVNDELHEAVTDEVEAPVQSWETKSVKATVGKPKVTPTGFVFPALLHVVVEVEVDMPENDYEPDYEPDFDDWR